MKVGLRLDLYRSAQLAVPVDVVRHAEDAGFHSVWTAEAYGTDVVTAGLLGRATRPRIARHRTCVLAARTPAKVAMHAMTIDVLAGGGRVIIGVGVSGLQIVEAGGRPTLGQTATRLRRLHRDLRKVMDREGPVAHDGTELSLPWPPGPARSGRARR